jgi:hypothetical protein
MLSISSLLCPKNRYPHREETPSAFQCRQVVANASGQIVFELFSEKNRRWAGRDPHAQSRWGVVSGPQISTVAELKPAGTEWWMARSANAAMMALYRSGMAFSRPWEPPQLVEWEGPFSNPHERLPQEPGVAARRRKEQRPYRERRRARKATQLAPEPLQTHRA